MDKIFEISKVIKIPNNITNNTASVDIKDPFKLITFPAIKIVAIEIRKGNLPITRYKIVCEYGNKSFSWRLYYPTACYTSSITTKSHAHRNDNRVVCNKKFRIVFTIIRNLTLHKKCAILYIKVSRKNSIKIFKEEFF